MPGVDWRLLKAQCYQESRLIPDAVSPAGAMGLCQFMPATWRGIIRQGKLPPDASAFAPRLSIEAAGFYMGKLRAEWSSPRPEWDRHSLALASYNAGLGHLLTAQHKCNGAVLYSRIIPCLPAVTGRHSAETINYVTSIWGWFDKMKKGW
ncbi:transglycosylase SLT domain-containing protein [Thalassospira sp. MCCC 1A01428]|uniref:transglycosylase SLT domain-containing protein n=1 Tax=Thalassospira sp. MCCC 1A01428 TaxID=1470575 RepID=UPI000A1FCF99|nr:transglycosylase SLT domain-containing protein [Thalassospira sp. MCCC 1A01428]